MAVASCTRFARVSLLVPRSYELAALDGVSKAVAACNSGYASSDGEGDAAAYETRWHRLRIGQSRPCHHRQRSVRGVLALQRQCHVAELAALDGIAAGRCVAACNSEYASSEGQGDAAAYQAS